MDVLAHKVQIKQLTESATVPTLATPNSAGYDVYSDENITIKAHEYIMVSTGIAIAMPSDMEAQVRPRSGLAIKNGVTVLNAPGTIDSDYRGEVKILLINHSDSDFLIEKGMRIGQMIFSKVERVLFDIVEQLDETKRGSGGFGSTGMV